MADTLGRAVPGRQKTLASESTLMLRLQRLGGVARNMIRISTIFIAICMVLVAASLGLILYSIAGISGWNPRSSR